MVWTPKYRLRILEGEVDQEVCNCIRAFSEQKKCEIIELNVQREHVKGVATIDCSSINVSVLRRKSS